MGVNTGLTIPFTGLRKQYNNLRAEILDATDEVLRSGQLMNGNYTVEFENWLAQKNQVRFAITCHSGTSALEIIAEYYANITIHPPTVLIPSLTYSATANAFIRAGWDIQFIDTDFYGMMDFKKIPPDLSYQAVVLVGLYGSSIVHMGDTSTWRQWDLRNITVIEDAAQHWLSAGCVRLGGASAISFDPMKNLPCYGNGGAVLTDDLELAEFAHAWRDNGKPAHKITGTNSRMSEIDCAHMMVKVPHLSSWQDRRASIAQYWIERLKKANVRSLIDDSNYHDHSYHKFVIEIDNRDIVQRNLALRKIETKVHYQYPLHEIGTFRQYAGPDILAVSSAMSRRVLSLPIYPELTDLEVEYIIDQVLDCV
jgi:dTDP-4-amino-4,6-dideoxygalactose transaminase